MLALYVALESRLLAAIADRDERGQAAAEYALVLLGAAGVALLVSRWAGATSRVGRLFDAVLDNLLARVR